MESAPKMGCLRRAWRVTKDLLLVGALSYVAFDLYQGQQQRELAQKAYIQPAVDLVLSVKAVNDFYQEHQELQQLLDDVVANYQQLRPYTDEINQDLQEFAPRLEALTSSEIPHQQH